MNRYAQATPCPAPTSLSTLARNNNKGSTHTSGAFLDDATANIDYTTQFKHELFSVKPRKRATRAKKDAAFDPSADMWVDDAIQQSPRRGMKSVPHEIREDACRSRSRFRRSAALAQPPQRIPMAHAPAGEDGRQPRRRRVSAFLAENGFTPGSNKSKSATKDADRKDKRLEIQKHPRRTTIYVPSDDTTIMTIHPGAYKGRIGSTESTMALAASLDNGTAPRSSVRREETTSRKSIAATRRRVPLQKSSRILQGASFSEDIVGSGTGKENVPPGVLVKSEKKFTSGRATPEVVKSRAKPANPEPTRIKKTCSVRQLVPTITRPEPSRKRLSSENVQGNKPTKALKTHRDATPARAPLGDKTNKVASFKSYKSRTLKRPQGEPPSKLSVPPLVQKAQTLGDKYKVISDDLSSPALYEDNWLSHQEVAMTQVINKLFDSVDFTVQDLAQEEGSLRRKLLSVYQKPEIPILYKRLQTSLMYGALNIPRNLLSKAIRIKDDVGLRHKYLKLFVDTYQPFVLTAALEAIVGRQVPISSRASSGATPSEGKSPPLRAQKKVIQDFLDTFLVRHEDAIRVKSGLGSIARIARGQKKETDDFGSHGWSWRRTVLRSLMLILLLDMSKTKNIVKLPLFQINSPHKSSHAVLQQLSSMLFPSLGDVSRSLRHFNYELQCVQSPLEEYSYRIENLATDMRDGVMLTRLVEVLLYSPTALSTQNYITITMPTGDTLTSIFKFDDKKPWVLSQHLKFPCLGRAHKLFNVQVVLSALEGIKGAAGRVAKEVTAEDVVDGHREKTLGLLWSLVGKWGLDLLVDWTELSKETQRHREQFYAQQGEDYRDLDSEPESDSESAELAGLTRHTARLKSWAHGIARLKGLRVANLTTSFADDRALEAIVDQYLGCFPSTSSTSSTSHDSSLKTKLKAIGCSDSFISLYTPPTTLSAARPIPSKDFNITTLAFLASRLLPASRAHRAACVIQRCYRLRLARRETTRRYFLMRLAADCATVVQTRDRVVGAAVVLQRAWRSLLDTRLGRLIGDVIGFQAAARGWASRRSLKASKIGKPKKRDNARGGW